MSETDQDARDDFSGPVIRTLGGRAGYVCSFPSCGRLTIGPSEDRATRLSNVGVAAHITAASKKGPRYDDTITAVERASEGNGIWLCQTHAKLVDDNSSSYSAEDLKRWKRQHEDWIFRRVANGHNHVQDGIGYLVTEGVGPLSDGERIRFGRLTVIFGANGTGKSTLCEAASAFAGDPHFSTFSERFDFARRATGRPKAIEAGLALEGVQTRVRISDRGGKGPERLRIEIDGNAAPAWPTSHVRAIRLDGRLFEHPGKRDPLEHAIHLLAPQFRLPEATLLAALRDEVFASSIYRCNFRRRAGKLEIRVPEENAGFLPPGNLAGSELRRLLVALTVRVMEADPGPAPWVFCLDTGFFGALDDDNKAAMIQQLAAMKQLNLQIIACVVFEQDVDLLRTSRLDRWIGAQRHGDLTIHAFL